MGAHWPLSARSVSSTSPSRTTTAVTPGSHSSVVPTRLRSPATNGGTGINRASRGQRFHERLLQVADPLVDVVRLDARVVLGERAPIVLVVVLDPQPGGEREPQVRERAHPGPGGRAVAVRAGCQA